MPELTLNTESVEPCTIVEKVTEEVQVLPIPTGEGTSKVTEAVGSDSVVVILQEFPLVLLEPSGPPFPENVS